MLSNEQKNVYLIIYNATMIARSLGKTFEDQKDLLKKFKKTVFNEVEQLTDKMDKHSLSEEAIINSIKKLKNTYNVSFGQAQKPINVLLKYHYYLYHTDNKTILEVLHCPLDSVVLKRLGYRSYNMLFLTDIEYDTYISLQNKIKKIAPYNYRLYFDRAWDEKHLKDESLI